MLINNKPTNKDITIKKTLTLSVNKLKTNVIIIVDKINNNGPNIEKDAAPVGVIFR